MERYFTAVSICCLHLIISGIRIPCVGYCPHGGIGIFEAGILHVIHPFYRYGSGNLAAVIQRSCNCESTPNLSIDCSHIICIPGNGNLLFGTIIIDDTYCLRKLCFCTEIAGYLYRGNTLYCQGCVAPYFRYLKTFREARGCPVKSNIA